MPSKSSQSNAEDRRQMPHHERRQYAPTAAATIHAGMQRPSRGPIEPQELWPASHLKDFAEPVWLIQSCYAPYQIPCTPNPGAGSNTALDILFFDMYTTSCRDEPGHLRIKKFQSHQMQAFHFRTQVYPCWLNNRHRKRSRPVLRDTSMFQ